MVCLEKKFKFRKPNIIFDATGNKNSMNKMFDIISFGGRIVYVGLFNGDISFNDPLFHRKEITLMASRNSISSDFIDIINLIQKNKINVDPWITDQEKFVNFPKVFKDWMNPKNKTIKAILNL